MKNPGVYERAAVAVKKRGDGSVPMLDGAPSRYPDDQPLAF